MEPQVRSISASFSCRWERRRGCFSGDLSKVWSPREALEEARSLIGILEMLKDKTEGRRTPREDQVLDGLLYELRMAYVARAREGGA